VKTNNKATVVERKAIGMSGVILLGGVLLRLATGANLAGAQTSGTRPISTEVRDSSPLAREVHHQLLTLPFYSVFDNIGFSLEGNKVTLYGQVLRWSLKKNAEAEIKSIEGIDVVVNRIEVLPTSANDDELRRSVYRSIFEDSTLSRYAVQAVPSIHIIVKNGDVALEGTVGSAADKDLATARTNALANVRGVKNNLIVRAKAGRAE
jgi:hyperosmotically inducible periplasmic protein